MTTLASNPNVTFKRNRLLGGYFLEYSSRFPLEVGKLPEIVERVTSVLTQEWPKLLVDSTSIEQPADGASALRNFKGRNAHEILLSDVPPPSDEELLTIGGGIVEEGGHWAPFSAHVHSHFQSFEATHAAIYSTTLHKSRELPSWFPLSCIATALPIELRYFRAGLEHLRQSPWGATFGYTPVVNETFLLDCSDTEARYVIRVDSRSRTVTNPLQAVPIFAALLRACDLLEYDQFMDTFLSI